MWDEKKLQSLINDEVEENLLLEYKGAGAIGRTDGKKKEISKDISAMANSAGGIVIYGITEFDSAEKRHSAQWSGNRYPPALLQILPYDLQNGDSTNRV